MESMASGGRSETAGEEEGQIPLDIDNVHLLLQVEQEQIQKRTFTNWINAQLAKHRPPTVVLDLFTDVRDGNRLLDLLEVISGQPMSRERGRSIFQCRANIETALTFLRRKSIKLVNINIPDIIEGKPSIVLGLIWTIILHFHIEELANSLAFSSRQSSMESLASIDSCSTIDSSSSRRSGTLHTKFKLSAKKALLLWAREQCQKAGANISIKDFKSSWRSGLAFLAILNSLRPDLVDLQKTKSRTNRENLEEAFRTAEHELKIPRLLEPEDVDINDPDDKSIMTYVAQFLQYSKDLPVSDEEMQGNLNQKVKGVTSWLTQAEQELEGSTGEADKESYEEKFHAFQTFVTTFNEQKRPIMPLLTAMRKTTQLTEDQVRLKEAWNKVTSKIREYKVALDLDLPSPLDGVGVWLQKIEPVLGEEIAESQDHEEVAGRIRDTLHLLKSLMEEMDVHWQTLQKFPNKDENGATRVPQEKMDELKRRFTSARVTAKYHGIKLEYQESKHSVQALICAVNSKLNTWKKKYGTKESVKLLQLDWHDFVEKQSFVTCLEAATEKLKLIASNYTSRTALAADSQYINKFLKQVDCDSSVSLASIRNVKAILARVVSGWDTYTENYNLLQQWLKEAQAQTQIHTAEVMSDWSTRHGRLNEAGNFLMEVTNEQTSSQLSEELKKLNRQWADFIKRTTFEIIPQPCESPRKTDNTAAINIMIDEATQILNERVDISASSLRTYIKRLEDLKRKIEEVDLDFILQSPEKSPVEFPPVKNVKDTLSEIADKCSGVQQDCQLLLSHVDTLESRLALLELWESEAGDIFNRLNTKQKGQEIDKKSLQLLITRGKEFERQVATAQEIVLTVTENIAKNRSLHHLQASGLQSRVNAVKDTLQVTMTNLNSAMQTKEASSSSEADIKLRFESSKQKLQTYITDVLALLSEKHTSEERLTKHEETLTRSETNILEEFLEASEQIKQITSSNQQQEVEKISKYLWEQWDAIHLELPLYLHLMKFEVEKGKCNGAVSQCEMQINKEIKLINSACIAGLIKEHQVCFSPEGSLGQADDHLQAMKGICKKLTADTSYSVTKTQLTECKQRKEEIEQRARHVYENLLTRHNEQQSSEKRQSSGHAELKVADVDSPVEAVSSVSSKVLLTTTQVTVRVANIPVVQQAVKLNVEEAVPAVQDKQDSNETEVLKSYRESKSVFELQLKKNRELILSEFPEDMVDTSVLRIKCQELQAAQEETETFWFEFEIQSSQLKGNMREPETRKRINHEWRGLKPSLQARLKSMETTVGILVPVEIQVTQLSDLLEQYQKKPKTLKRFTVTGADSVQKDIKELQERIQRHIVNSSVLEKPGSPSVAGLDSRDQLAIHKIVLVCKKKLQKMIYSIHDSEVVMKTLEAFLASLRTAENDIDRLPTAPSADVVALRKSKVKLEVIQKDINFMRDKAVHIDELLNKVEICLQEAESSKAMTCQQMIAVLSQKLEDTKEFIMKHEQNLQQEEVLRPILVRKEDLIKNLWEAQQKTDSEGLKEPTLPALLQRLRSLKELRNNLGSFEGELLKLRETANQLVLMSSEEKAKHLVDLETLWEETERSVTEGLKSMETAVGFLVPLDNEVALLSDSLDQFKKKPKTLKRFTMPGAASVQKDLKELQRRIQRNIRNSSAFEKLESPAAAGLDPRDQQAIQSIVLVCKNKLEEMDHSVHDSEVAMKTLEAFLASLRTAENDIDRLQAAPSSDVVSLCKSKVELEAIQQDINSMRDKAVHIDELLNKAEIRLQEAESSKGMTCQQMIAVLSQKLEDTKEFIMKHEQSLQQEVLRSILVKKNALMTRLQEVQEKADSVGLMEPTLPALHKRLRILVELENQMRSCEGDLQRLRERANQIPPTSREEETMSLVDLDTLWEETERTVTEGQEQCSVLMGLLKKFQGYRSDLSNTLQRAETTISEQASYMGKDNLHRLIEKVGTMKEELSGSSDHIDEIRTVCRQLQSQLKKIQSCKDTAFESEADSLVDRWLDVTEKTDIYLDNIKCGLTLWEKLISSASDIEEWTTIKLGAFSEHHRFRNQQEITDLEDEIQAQERNIERFHCRAAEIQELLQSKESPLELQVIETQLKKRMEQVKELYEDSSEVFQEFTAVKKHIADRLIQSHCCLQAIEESVHSLAVSDHPNIFDRLKHINKDLLNQTEQVDSLLAEINLLASVANPQDLEELNKNGAKLTENLQSVQELLLEKVHSTEDHFIHQLSDEVKVNEDWLQDIQLSVNECFEYPEQRQDVEASLHKLNDFLMSEDGEKKIHNIKKRFSEIRTHLPVKHVNQISGWLQDQEAELKTFTSHCQQKHRDLQDCLESLNKLQEEYTLLDRWLQSKVQKSLPAEGLEQFYQEIVKQREKFDGLSSIVDSLRKQGLTYDQVVKESSKLIERYQNLLVQIAAETEAQEALSKDLEAFDSLRDRTLAWITGLKESIDTVRSTEGSKSMIEERIQRTEEILQRKPEGDLKIQLLNDTGTKLTEKMRLDNRRSPETKQTVVEITGQWNSAFQSAEEHCSHLKEILGRWNSYLEAKEKVQLKISEISQQKLDLSVEFVWPDLAGKYESLEKCRMLLQEAHSILTAFDMLKVQKDALFHLTHDVNFNEASWVEMLNPNYCLLKDLKGLVHTLEDSIERHHRYQKLLKEFHTTQDSFSEEIPSLRATPKERPALEKILDRLKGMLNPISRQEEVIRDVTALGDSLKKNTTRSGQAAITQEIQSLQSQHQDTRRAIVQVEEHCEGLLNEILLSEKEFTRRVQRMKQDAGELEEELSVLSQTLSPIQENSSLDELAEHWRVNMGTKNTLDRLESRVENLKADQQFCTSQQMLPEATVAAAEVIQKYYSLLSQTSDGLHSSKVTLENRFFKPLQALQQWTLTAKSALCVQTHLSPDSALATSTIQDLLNHREMLKKDLKDVLPYQELLMDAVGQEQSEKLATEISNTLQEENQYTSTLCQELQALEDKKRHEEESRYQLSDTLARETGIEKETPQPELPEEHQQIQTPPTIQDQKKHAEVGNYQLIDCPDEEVGAEVEQTLQPDLLEQQIQTSETHQDILVPPGEGQKELIEVRSAEQLQIDTGGQEKMMELEMSSFIASPGTFGETKRYEDKHKCEEVAGSATVTGLDQEQTPLPDLPVEQQLIQTRQAPRDQNKLGEEPNRQQTESSTTGTGQQKEPTSQPGHPEQQSHRAEMHQELEYSSSEGLSAQSKGPQFTELELDSEHVPAADSRSTQDLQQQDCNLNEMQTSSKDIQLGTETASQLHRPAECMDIEGDKLKKALTRYAALKTKLETELIEASQRVSYLKIQAAELNIEAMNKQLNETEEVSRDFEQKQAAALKQMKAAEVSELRTVTQTDVEQIQAQWNKHVQDLSSLKQSKESQLSLIKEYHCSADAVKHLFEKLSTELETLEQGPVESCSFHAETVQKILSTIEQEKVILQELGKKQEQISHHLNETEKKALQIQLEHWDQKGNQMASAAERTLYVVSKEVEEYRCLLLESQELQKQVDNLQLSLTDLKGSPPEEEIDKRKSWMILSADLTATQHNFTHLKRNSQILIQHMLGQREKDSLENSVHQLQARLDLMQEQASAHSEEEKEDTSSATTISKLMKVMKEAFTWVKKADGDITANNRIALFPEDVSVQINNLKELQSEIIAKQSTMDSFVSEVKVLMSELDEKDVPKVSYLLQTLGDLHKSAAQKSTQKLHELECALQARERLFEKIASINTWLEAHTEKEHIKENDSESNTLELEHQVKESNDILHKSKEQEMLLESLLVNSKEISAEINISENYYLSDRLKCLQNNIKRVITSQKMRCWNVEEMLNTCKNTEGKLESLACDLKETMSYMNIDGILLSKDAVSTRNALKLKTLEHKSQLDQLCSCEYFQKEKLSELQSLLADTEKKMKKLNSSVQEYEKYQTVLQNIEHLKERAEKEILHIKEAPGFKIDKLKRCQVLLLDLQQWMLLCQQSGDTLNKISPTLDPTLLDSEEQRIQYLVEECNKWNQALQKESLDLEKQLLEEQDFQTVQESTLDFLREARHELASSCMSLDQEVIERKLQECKALQNYMQVLMRILKSLEHKELESLKKAASDSPGTTEKKCNEIEDMERQVKDDCASRMDILIKAKEAAREYDEAVRSAAGFLCQSEASLLPRPINVSFCELQLHQHQENLSKCHAGFESKISDMQQILPRLESIPHTFLPQHANILSELLVRNAVLRGQAEIKLERMQRCVEKYKNYKEYKQEISTNFNNLERMFATSISQKATSYKESLEQLEKLKILVAKLDSMEDLVKLRAIASELQCEEWDSSGIKQEVSALWYAWLQLQQPAKEHQVSCENLNKEWKAVNENIERAAVILDNLQDDLPECSKEKAAKEDLLDLQKHVNQYEDSVNNEQSSLVFLVHKVKGLLGVTENVEAPSIPICQKLQEMQDRYKKLKQKAMKSRKSVDTEIQEREKVKDEIRGVKEWLLHVVSLLSVVAHTPNITELEEVQTELDTQRAAVKNIMAKLKIKYSNMDAIVPAEIEAQLQEVSRTLQEVGEQVEKAVVQNSHHHLLHNKIEDITNGLHNVDKMLQQKSQTINQAKEMQKRVWDEVDRWHSRLTSLEAEVQDLAEQNPNQAQQMMDSLMEPLQLYQRAAQQAEQRTAFLSKITNCLQEYNEMINSSNVWIDDTQAWLSMEFVFDSAKSLHKNVKALQIASDDGLQRQKTLQGFAPILQEISLVCDTMALEEQGSHVDQKITALLEGIMGPLSQLQHVATELEAMETEVKLMEKNVAKIRTILSSDDMDEISPEEHLRNREVILENIQSMKKTIAAIKNYEPREAIASLMVFKRAEQLLPAMEELEHTTVQQKAVLQSAIEQLIGQRQDMEMAVQEEYPDEMSTSPAEYTQPPTGFRIPQIPAEGYSIDRLYYEGPDTGSEDGGSTKSSSSETLTGSILEEHEETFTVEDATALDTVQMRPDNNDMSETQAIPQETTCGVVSFEPEEHHTPEDLNTETTSSVQLEAEDNETSSMQPVPHEEEHEETFTVEDATAVDTVQMRPDNNDMCETQAIPQETTCGVVSFAGPGELQQLPGRPEPHSILHVCRERAAQLEIWLEKATATFRADRQDMEMQQSVAQQLLMCQSMFLEIEQKVAFLSDLAQQEEAWCQEGTASTHQEAEALSSKLEGLKSSLVKFQMLLQERHNEEQDGKHPSETPLQRSASVQEMLASAKTKLNRQDSLQQQKELEMELSEQKDLTKYLALHGERMLLQKEGADTQQQASLRTSDEVSKSSEGIFMKPLTGIEASAHESDDQASTKWQRLQNRLSSKLKTLEETAHQDLFSQVSVTTRSCPIADKLATYSIRSPNVPELKTYITQLRELSQEATVILSQACPSKESCSELDQNLHNVLNGTNLSFSCIEDMISGCYEMSREDAKLQLSQLENLPTELADLHTELSGSKEPLIQCVSLTGGEEAVLSDCLNSLQSCLCLLQSAVSSRSTLLQARLDHITDYQAEIRQMHAFLFDKRSVLLQALNEASGQSIAVQLQVAEQLESTLPPEECQVSALKEQGERLHLQVAVIQEVCKLEDVLENTWCTLRVAREELKESLTTEIQYESLLQGLSSLVDAGHEKLARNQHLVLPSRTVLKNHLKKHKNYFHNLGNHLAAVERFSQKVPVALARKHDKFWLDLVEEIHSLQQQALQHGIRIQSMLQAWTHFDKSSTVLLKELQELEARIPTVGLVEESEERLLERLAIYQQIKGSLDENCSRLSQTLTNGKKLLTTVSCTELESGLRQLEEKWLTVMNRVDHDSHCLETITKYWSSFRKGSIELSVWMTSAMDRLKSLKQQSLSVPQDLEKVRDHLGQFLEFMKEVDAKSSVKSSLISTGNQLLQVKQADTASLQNQLAQFEQGWTEVLTPLPGIQEKLHQLQMEKVPSRQAITELKTWMSEIHGLLREDEEKISHLSTTASAKEILQKYKDYKTEMNCKQLTVDFVNQSVLQISSLNIQSKRYDMAEFAECLGALNLQWQLLQGALSSKMQAVEHMLAVFTEKERKMQLISCWCKAQEERILGFQTPASLTSAENALKDCQEIEEKLKIKSKEIQELKHCYLSPAEDSSEHLHIDFIAQVDEVNTDWTHLNNQVIQTKASLQSTVQQWKAFDETFQEVDLNIIKARYTLESSHFPVLSFEALKSQVEKLKSLLEDAEKNEESWNALSSVFTTRKTMCSPTAVKLITENLEDARTRWTAVNQDSSDELRKAQSLYQLWQKYRNLFIDSTLLLKTHEEECSKLLSTIPSEESTVDFMQRKIDTINKLVNETENIQSITAQVSETSKELIQQVDPSAAILIASEITNLSSRLAQLRKLLAIKLSERQDELKQLEEFNRFLASLEHHLKDSEGIVANTKDPNISDPSTMDQSRTRMLKLYAMTPDLEYLNDLSYKIPLNDVNIKRVQTLNRQWAQASSRALERCSELQGVLLDKQNFVQKCENWMRFLEKMEDSLAVDIAGCYVGLKEQQRIHELFQAEVSIGHQILHSVINEARHLLERGEVEDRSEFILKLSLLKEQWQGAIRRAQQRKGVIEGLVRQWHYYQDSLKKLKTFLSDTANHLDLSNSQAHHGLHQTRREVEDIKHKEMLFQRHRCSYILTLETGKQIFSMANPETETLLQEELCELQESWEHTETLLKKKKQLMNTSLESWENCENKINEFGRRLQDIKIKVSDPLPQVHEELQATEKQTKEAEESLEDWTRSLAELSTMKTDLSQYIITDDVVILQEQIQHLHSQWDELCLKVSLRKQEIADRLNAWIIFNEKNKELCEWLTEMENKVSHNAELSIEEMVEKLKKDCMEEINLFSENKTHLKILGEQLLNASNKTKETEINDKLKDINDRWQHLFDHIEARVKKLKETQVTVQQLDKNMSNLRTWLSHIEAELSKPVVYNICDNDEIQKKLSEQQDLQRDIEQHTDGVASVINLCDVLLHDSDACATETECDSIQQTTASLDRRWRNICAMSMERRMKIEETCRLWSKFLDDYSRFEDWLKTAERTAACPNSSEVLYTSAKEELKKFEAFQRQVHERLTQLELVNKQYRRLARENRTDTASRLKLMVHEGNQRWDNLQKRVAAILRRLKYFTSQREEFEGTRDGILVWLTEMDLQLTNVEHFSESDIEDKMRQLEGFQQEITLNTNKIDQLIVFGENLIQKSQPLDAVLIEDELEELHSYCQEVFGRVARFHHRLINKGPVSEDEKESSDRDTDLEDSAELQGIGWQEKMGHEVSPSCQSTCQLMPPTPGQERSGRETPISVDSIPLEWDHTVDVGGSSSHEDEEEPVYYSALSDVEIAENPESFVKMTSKTLKATSVKSPSEPPSWHSPDHQDSRKQRIQTEIIRNLSSTSPTTSTPYKLGYVKLMSECSGSIDSVKRVKLILNDEEQLEEQGLVGLTTVEKQSGVIERWELIQAQGLSNKLRKKQNLQQWQQLNSDLHDITSWIKQIEPELDELQKLESSTSIQDIEGNIKKLKEIQKAFDNYKSVVISLNLISKDFQQADSDESQELHGRMGLMNQSWVQACNKLDCWKEGLQTALMQCQDFHETTHDLLLWLAHAVSRRYTVDLADSSIKSCVLQEHQKTLMQLEGDLLEKQLQVSSLQEISTHLLVKADEEDHIEAKEKVHVIENKLKLLLREVSQDMQTIQKKLDTCSSFPSLDEVDCSDIAMTSTPLSQIKEASEEKITATKASTNTRPGRRESSPPRSFFYRVLRAAFPLQVLFLLLLVLACLVPLTEEDYSCSLSNNFARSFYPMLRYTNGPPPT